MSAVVEYLMNKASEAEIAEHLSRCDVDFVPPFTSVSVLREWSGKGNFTRLISQCIEHAKVSGMRQISLEVASDNTTAIRVYEKKGFVAGEANASFVCMNLYLWSGE